MMSIGAALTTAALRLGPALAAGPIGTLTARTIREVEEAPEEVPGTSPEEAALLVAVEAGLREAGYLAN